jgi:hypothetical protein
MVTRLVGDDKASEGTAPRLHSHRARATERTTPRRFAIVDRGRRIFTLRIVRSGPVVVGVTHGIVAAFAKNDDYEDNKLYFTSIIAWFL